MVEREPEPGDEVWDCPFHHDRALDFDPLLQRLLDEEKLTRVRMPHGTGVAWLASRYRDVRQVTTDSRFSRAAGIGQDLPRMTPEPIAHPDAINLMDPPAHTRLRRAIAKGFTPAAVARLRPRITELAERLVDGMIGAGAPVDLVTHFSAQLPLQVASEMLGVPEAEQTWLRHQTVTIMATAAENSEVASQAKEALRAYFTQLVERRRREPGDDLLSAMAETDDGDDARLTDAELAMLGQVLMVAGHDTLTYEISNIVYTLLTTPDVLTQVRRRPELLPAAIEEALRIIPFRQGVGIARVATEDVELGGRRIRSGEPVHVSYLTANRDPEVFAHPNEFVLERVPTGHLTFGNGPHKCPGARLARAELHAALSTLLSRLPRLRLAVDPADVRWNTESIWRYPLELPVRW